MNFFKKDTLYLFIMSRCVHLHVGMYTLMKVLTEGRGFRFPGAGVIDYCELSSVGAGN